MLIKRERLEYINKYIFKRRVVSLKELVVNSDCTERNLRRNIRELKCINSYTHYGKYVTLSGIPLFDDNGVWFFNGVGFTKFKNSYELILNVIEASGNGLNKNDIEDIVRIKISKQIQLLMQKGKLNRVKYGNKYYYLPSKLKNKKQILTIFENQDIERFYDKKIKLSDIIAVLKIALKEYKIDIKNLSPLLKKYSLDISIEKLTQIISRYKLHEKKML